MGASDMNWEGKEVDSFLFNEDVEDFNLIKFKMKMMILKVKNKIIKFIEATRLSLQQNNCGLPSYFFFGFGCGTYSIISTINNQRNIYVAKNLQQIFGIF